MKKEYILDLSNLIVLNKFVMEITSKIPCEVDAIHGRHVIDAKSVLGLVSIAIHPVKVRINTDNKTCIDNFNKICQEYKIKER